VVLILPEPHKQSATNNHREHPPPTRQNLSTVTQDNRQRMHKLICRENRENTVYNMPRNDIDCDDGPCNYCKVS